MRLAQRRLLGHHQRKQRSCHRRASPHHRLWLDRTRTAAADNQSSAVYRQRNQTLNQLFELYPQVLYVEEERQVS